MNRSLALRAALVAALALAALPAPAPAARAPRAAPLPDCAALAHLAPVPGAPGTFRLETPLGPVTARHPATPTGGAPPTFVIRAQEDTWDADGVAATSHDTLVVPVGATVRWHLVAGLHTLTSGRDRFDPAAGAAFDYLLDEAHPDFDSTFTRPDTLDYFCWFHDPAMSGTLIVSANAGVPGDDGPVALGFARPPAPNPSRGAVGFAVTLPRDQRLVVEVLDLAGRRVARLADEPRPAGEHAFRWNGVGAHGEAMRSGVYALRVRAGDQSVTRRFSLLR